MTTTQSNLDLADMNLCVVRDKLAYDGKRSARGKWERKYKIMIRTVVIVKCIAIKDTCQGICSTCL